MVLLRGITWNHVRGYSPLLATASTYMASHPGIRIEWETRTLQEFADIPIQYLAERYDLIAIDHSFVGFAAGDGCLMPLDEYLDTAYLTDQEANSVGRSYASYTYGGHQWALAIDASAQVSAYRPDLLYDLDADLPQTWDEVVALARRFQRSHHGRVAIPLAPRDALMSFFSLCCNAGEPPCVSSDLLVGRATGRYALNTLQALRDLCHRQSLVWSPPKALDRMSSTDEIAYIPLLFGYSNYARPAFRSKLVRFTNIPSAGHGPQGAILGGTGIAVAGHTDHPEAACDYAAYVASADVQRTIYFDGGGQPGYRAAWLEPALNAAAGNYFIDTLETVDRSYLRPRYYGYTEFQERAGRLLYAFLCEGGSPHRVLDDLDEVYRRSLVHDPALE